MENTINEYLNYLKSNNLQNDISNYFTSYVSENHPNSYQEFITPIEEPKNLKITELSKINNPIVAKPKQFNISAITQPTESNKTSNITVSDIPISGSTFKNKQDFIKAILPYARKIAKEKGIDENIIISQAAFESGYGSNSLTKKANNIFSIQGKGFAHVDKNQKGEVYNTSFKKYNNLGESLNDWSNMVLNPNSKRYNKSYLAAKQNPEEFFKVHSWSGYAEGIGKTKQEAKQRIYNGYKSAYNDIINLRKKYNI